MKDHPNELLWHHFLAGEISWFERRKLRSHLENCISCQKIHGEILEQRSQFERSGDRAARFEAIVKAAKLTPVASGSPAPTWRRIVPIMAPTLAAFFVGLLIWGIWPSPESGNYRAKGEDLFVLLAKREDKIEPLGSTCRPGERLRGKYQTEKPYLLIINKDEQGGVQVLFPLGGQASVPLTEPQGLTPGSWELDEEPGRERFVAIFSKHPIELHQVISILSQGKDSPIVIEGASVVEISCTKEQP